MFDLLSVSGLGELKSGPAAERKAILLASSEPEQNGFSVVRNTVEGIVQEVHNDRPRHYRDYRLWLGRTEQKGLPMRLEEILEPDLDRIQR